VTLPLRDDFDAASIRAAARRSTDSGQQCRLRAIAAIYDGASRDRAALIAGVTRQTVRDWVMRFNSDGLSGLRARRPSGRPCILRPCQRAWLAKAVGEGPVAELGVVVPWNVEELLHRLDFDFDVVIGRRTLLRELAQLGVTETSRVWSCVAFVQVASAMSRRAFDRRMKIVRDHRAIRKLVLSRERAG
jgi:transposase